MPDSVNELIAKAVLARINEVTPLNGYAYNLTAVRKRHHRGSSPVDLLAVIVEPDEQQVDPASLGALEWLKPFEVHCYVTVADDATTSMDERANLIVADVYKAITTDYHWDNGSGELALDTHIQPPTKFEPEDGSYLVGIANFAVHYRHSETDPFTQI